MSLAAAIDSGRFGPAEQRRILLVSNNATAPEVVPPLDAAPGFAALRPRFDEVISWNDLLWPFHPSTWHPREQEWPLLNRLLRRHWSLVEDEPLHLVVESIQVPPARAFAEIFDDATITVYSDGLMSYGPTRESPPRDIATRIDQVLYLDLVSGLEPLLLSEYDIARATIATEAFRAVVTEVTKAVDGVADRTELAGQPMLIGQYLAALDIVTAAEEDELHARMLRGVAAQGSRTVLFKPHPSSTTRTSSALRATAERLGVDLVMLDDPVPVEVWYEALRPSLVVGAFSTGLSTASCYYDIPIATVGTELLLERITPYQNSNRIPITLADATMPRLAEDGTVHPPRIPADRVQEELLPLLVAVSYCMQNSAYPHLRDEATAYLAGNLNDSTRRYFKKRRGTP
ncbi:alpha-2,8-polysialyltransferase family protein, partial [Thermobifida halotolerans]|uniref:alpha-2,8-polysialyltransferase family protein n=1 Tax=Thermobifida halotolerans TaxID=483545 RepID=UPI001F3ACCF0